jgi:cell division septation protein DedD
LARTDEGEFELVLGNKQLISVFLIVVILLAVFFSMGYIVGRSSAPSSADATRPANKDIAVEHSTAPASTPSNPALEKSTAPAESKPAEVHPEKPSPVTVKEPAKETKPATPPPAPTKPAAGEPVPGDYWQVVATSKEDADIVARALTKKGFHTTIAPVPGDNRFRVLVGPLANSAAQAQTRSDLEASGFKNPIMRKY